MGHVDILMLCDEINVLYFKLSKNKINRKKIIDFRKRFLEKELV